MLMILIVIPTTMMHGCYNGPCDSPYSHRGPLLKYALWQMPLSLLLLYLATLLLLLLLLLLIVDAVAAWCRKGALVIFRILGLQWQLGQVGCCQGTRPTDCVPRYLSMPHAI
jgi:hypothetical protein